MTASAALGLDALPNGNVAGTGRWRLFCSHGTILFYVARHPGCTNEGIAEALSLTQRTVWGLIGDLRRAGLLTVRREGKRHYYAVDLGGRFPDPILSHLTLGEAMRAIEANSPDKGVADFEVIEPGPARNPRTK